MASGYIFQAQTDKGIIVLTHRLRGNNGLVWQQYRDSPERVLREAIAAGNLANETSNVTTVYEVQQVVLKNQKPVQVIIHSFFPAVQKQ